ncbi:hypothetical protein QBZ16_000636 [Prototheca wickerhamii]|uniref:Uncharacterized protein n=1 Tax=Prototheca wickerhamii TaxID=3111 RepID=A0AAD9IPM3_PROWI|nr:hypothetical protein QBZ16_000636 [Prototheca wickerhamii]
MSTRSIDPEGPGGRGGVTAQVPKDVADRFEAAVNKHQEAGTKSDEPLDDKHKSGMEPVTERARDLKDVAEAKGSGDDTRAPESGFPADK